MKFLAKMTFFLLISAGAWAQAVDPFSYTVDLSPRHLFPGGETPIEITFFIPPKHYLYKDKTTVSLVQGVGFELESVKTSPSLIKKDPFTGLDEEIFEEMAVLKTSLRAKAGAAEGSRSVKLELTYQGCSEKLCFRFMRREITIPVTLFKTPTSVPPEGSILKDPLAAFHKKGFLVALLISFLGGLGSALTPCVLPIIPITLAFIGVRKEGESLGKNFLLSLLLVLSMSLTYAALGLLASLLGKSLGFLFQNPYFLSFGVILYVSFSLSLFGFFDFQVPMRLRSLLAKMGGAGIVGSILSGFTVGFLAAPCVGPVIASLLLYVAKERDVVHGSVLLFIYGLGMGSLFLVVGTFYHQLASKIHGGAFTVWIKRVFAVLLLIPAFYYGSIVYAQLGKEGKTTEGQNTFWVRSVEEGFGKARASGKLVFMDFYASWCLPCVEMEKGTFSDPGLQNFLLESFVPIKVDCTEETPDCKAMVDRYGVVGWPTFLILTSEGEVLRSLIGQSLSSEELQKILKSYSE